MDFIDDYEQRRALRMERASDLVRELKEVCPILSETRIMIGDLFYEKGSYRPCHNCVMFKITNELERIHIYSEEETKIKIENRLNSTYQFKKSGTSTYEFYQSGTHDDSDLGSGSDDPFDKKDYVRVKYYAIVEENNIEKFIKDSSEMDLDPISDGKYHAADVYVISEKVLPLGFVDLVKKSKESRNMTLYLVTSESGANDFIDKFSHLESLSKNNPQKWLSIVS